MPGLIINGKQIHIQGLNITNYLDNPKLTLKVGEDGRVRQTTWIRGIVMHTTKGQPGGPKPIPQLIKPGFGTVVRDNKEHTARYWSTTDTNSGAHLIIDFDGSIACTCDLSKIAAYHAPPTNEIALGLEIYQGNQAEMYDEQLNTTVILVDALTNLFGIQRQVQSKYYKGPIERMKRGGTDVVGVYGHRDVTNNRGEGDPGNAIMQKLMAAGYEAVDFAKNEDIVLWQARQKALGLKADGIPGPSTVLALKKQGKKAGLWVERPIDKDL